MDEGIIDAWKRNEKKKHLEGTCRTLKWEYYRIYYLRAAAPAADPCGPGPLLHHAGQVPEGRDRDH